MLEDTDQVHLKFNIMAHKSPFGAIVLWSKFCLGWTGDNKLQTPITVWYTSNNLASLYILNYKVYVTGKTSTASRTDATDEKHCIRLSRVNANL